MKIGILTFHKADNFGAALQAYALVRYLEGKGHDVEIIDYYTDASTDRYLDKNRVKGKKIKMILSKWMLYQRRKKFNDFRKELNISKETYRTKEKIIQSNKLYDLFIAGSDQIWNYKMTNADSTYLLDFVNDLNKKMSYASSFGLSEIEDNVKDLYQKDLKCIPRISVRERLGAELVKDLIGITPRVVLDPCLLLSKDRWKEISTKEMSHKKPYILVYMFTGSNYSKIVSGSKLDTSKYDIVKINGNITFRDFLSSNTKVRYGIGPKEFIDLFLNAELIFTDSFHGTVFSVIFQKKFVTVLRAFKGKNARIIDFLKPLNLEHRIYNDKMTSLDILSNPKYDEVQNKLDVMINDSKQFIDESLSNLDNIHK